MARAVAADEELQRDQQDGRRHHQVGEKERRDRARPAAVVEGEPVQQQRDGHANEEEQLPRLRQHPLANRALEDQQAVDREYQRDQASALHIAARDALPSRK